MRIYFLLLLLAWCNYTNAQIPFTGPVNKANFEQKFRFTVAGKETILNENVDLLGAVYQSSHLMINILKDRKNIKFSFFVSVKELKKGSYTVVTTGGADDQVAIYSPDIISSTSLPKSGGNNIPSLNLKPLEFVIDAVEDAKIPNVPLKVKRLKGHFNGIFATVEDNSRIIGNADIIKGEFDLTCMIMGQE